MKNLKKITLKHVNKVLEAHEMKTIIGGQFAGDSCQAVQGSGGVYPIGSGQSYAEIVCGGRCPNISMSGVDKVTLTCNKTSAISADRQSILITCACQ